MTITRPGALPLTLSEAQFARTVIDYAKLRGWLVVHYRPAPAPRHGQRWVTPLQGDPGAPDLILARWGVVILAELKSQRGKARPMQIEWLDELGEHGRLWRPSDWPEIYEELR